MSVTARAALRLAALVLVAVPFAACGSDDSTATDPVASDETTSDTPSGSPSTAPAEGPDCATTWQEGAELPRDYSGCVDDSGTLVAVEKVGCSSGQALLMYDDMYWGVAGGTIKMGASPLSEDPAFLTAVRRCRA